MGMAWITFKAKLKLSSKHTELRYVLQLVWLWTVERKAKLCPALTDPEVTVYRAYGDSVIVSSLDE